MRKTLLLAVPLTALLASCQTWGPTWSEISGTRYTTVTMYRLPSVIDRIDGQSPSAQYPIKIEPGKHVIQTNGTLPGWPGATLRTIDIDVAPCKRYYINNQYKDLIQPEYTPVVDYVEVIIGCTVTVAAK